MMVTEKDVFEAMLEKAENKAKEKENVCPNVCPDKLCKDCEVDCICKEFELIDGRDEEFDLFERYPTLKTWDILYYLRAEN